jgi:hypothetical protein
LIVPVLLFPDASPAVDPPASANEYAATSPADALRATGAERRLPTTRSAMTARSKALVELRPWPPEREGTASRSSTNVRDGRRLV